MTFQVPLNVVVFEIAEDRSVTFTVGPGTGLCDKCLLQSQQSDVMVKAGLFLETKELSVCLFLNAYLHSLETEYKITDCTWSFYETRKKTRAGILLSYSWSDFALDKFCAFQKLFCMLANRLCLKYAYFNCSGRLQV